MSTALHLALVDLRRLWPGLVALLGLHVLRASAVEMAPLTMIGDSARASAFTNGEGIALLIEVLATLLAVSIVVHRDPLVGRRAFWLSRPIAPRTLLLAKALTLSPIVIVPMALNAGRLVAYGADASAVLASSLQLALSRATWIGLAWLVAAVTPSTLTYILAGIGTWIALIVWLMARLTLRPLLPYDPVMLTVPLPPLPSDGSAYVGMGMGVALSLAVLTWQYTARRRVWATVFTIATLAIVMNAQSFTPAALARAPEPQPPVWFSAIDSGDILLAGHRVAAESSATHDRPRAITSLSGRLDVAGLRGGYSMTAIPRTSRVSAGDRTVEGRGQATGADTPQRRLDFVLAAPIPSSASSQPHATRHHVARPTSLSRWRGPRPSLPSPIAWSASTPTSRFA